MSDAHQSHSRRSRHTAQRERKREGKKGDNRITTTLIQKFKKGYSYIKERKRTHDEGVSF